jgi:hypothetical protein
LQSIVESTKVHTLKTPLLRTLLYVFAVLLAVVLLCALASALGGSLELFPTQEQDEKSRIASVLVAVLAGALELGVLYVLSQTKRK